MSALVPVAKPTAIEPVQKPEQALVKKPLNILNLNPSPGQILNTDRMWKGRPVMRTKEEVRIVQVDSDL